MLEFLFQLSIHVCLCVLEDSRATQRGYTRVSAIRAHQMQHVGVRGFGETRLITAHDLVSQ